MSKYNCAVVIDSDPIGNFVTAMTLEKSMLVKKINTSIKAEDAIDKIKDIAGKESCPDLIILDLLNNDEVLISFFENFRKLELENSKSIKLILLTSDSARGIDKAEKFGYTYIKKPITEDKLISVL